MNNPLMHKFVAVLNKKVDQGKVMNALGHMAAGLVAKYPEKVEAMRFDSYVDADGNDHASISDNPFIILKAKNSNKLRAFREALIEKGVGFVDFADMMTEGTYVEQQERTRQTPESELEYYGVCAFGEAAVLNELTGKFSLWS